MKVLLASGCLHKEMEPNGGDYSVRNCLDAEVNQHQTSFNVVRGK